jgi:hypothetical protein
MRLHKKLAWLAAALAIAGLAAPAPAQEQQPDFNIVVNFNLQNLHPDVRQIDLECYICTGPCSGPENGGHVLIDTGGAQTFTEQIVFPVTAQTPVAQLTNFLCGFSLVNADGVHLLPRTTYTQPERRFATAKEGTPLTQSLGGAFEQ